MTIAIASQKGGTGKTSTSISLAAGLARRGKKVLLLDVDSQANSSKVLLPDYQNVSKEETIYETIINCNPLHIRATSVPSLDIAPSHILLADTDVELTTAIDHREGDCTIVCGSGRIRTIDNFVGGSHEYSTRTD